jgi:hypothetical protein
VILTVILIIVSFPALAQPPGAPQASIVLNASAGPLEHLAAEELQRYVKTLFNVDALIVAERPRQGLVFDLQVITEGLSDQGILLWPQGDLLLVGGGSPRALLWAVYELVQRWGVRYLVSGDVLPGDPGLVRFPESEVRLEPNMRIRCWRLVNDLPHGPISWSLDENRRFLRQIAKMKYNRVHVSLWPCQPFVHYTFHGMEKPAPILFYGERYPLDFDTVARDKFGTMTEFSNPDLAPAKSPAELLQRGLDFVHGILKEARALGMETGLSIQPFEWPKEFAAVLPGAQPVTQLGSLTIGPGQDQNPDDPLLREMVATVFRAYVDTYPEADYVHVGMPEHRGWTAQAKQAYDLLDRKYGLRDLGTFEELCARARARTTFPGGGARVETMLKGDLSTIAFFDALLRDKDLLKRPNGQPDIKLVYTGVVEELFPLLARLVPPGGEVLSFIDYTASRQLKQRDLLRQRPPENLPASLIFTLADDNVGVLPQLATGSLHELMQELRANGWRGFYTRYWTIGDLNPTVHYMARASWDLQVTPDGAYKDLIEHVCGPASVEPAVAAFHIIEAITRGLDDYGLGFGFPVPAMMTKHYEAGGLAPEIKADRARYREALDKIRAAREPCHPSGRAFLDYFVGRLTFAVEYLDAAQQFGETAAAEKAGNRLDATRRVEQAYRHIRDAIAAWAGVANDHGDLGAVALLNEFCYRPIRDKRNALAGGAGIIERVPVGEKGDYKPCIVRLSTGELLITAFHQNQLDGGKIREDILLFRSQDGGRAWSKGQVIDILGRESYFSVLKDDTLLITVHLLPQDIRNKDGYTHAYIHRSTDAGKTWTTTRAQPGALPAGTENVTTRNVLELADGSLLVGISGSGHGRDFIWRSADAGRTWAEQYPAQVDGVRDDYPFPFFGEAMLWQAASGQVYAIARVDSKFFPPLSGRNITLGETDHFDRMILFASTDTGHTWRPVRDFGDYGEMYPALLRLQDGRLLLTFTVREVKRPLGVNAVLGLEQPDGFEFNFDQPRFLLDTKTPNDKDSGGGFGRTVQIDDGTLVTSYSFRGEDNDVHCEVVRWKLPAGR